MLMCYLSTVVPLLLPQQGFDSPGMQLMASSTLIAVLFVLERVTHIHVMLYLQFWHKKYDSHMRFGAGTLGMQILVQCYYILHIQLFSPTLRWFASLYPQHGSCFWRGVAQIIWLNQNISAVIATYHQSIITCAICVNVLLEYYHTLDFFLPRLCQP